jgi:hypothetical protein
VENEPSDTEEEEAVDRYVQNGYKFTKPDAVAFPYLVELCDSLLAKGGQQVNLGPALQCRGSRKPFIDEILRYGGEYPKKNAEFQGGEPHRCYENAKKIVHENSGFRYVRGWALSRDRSGVEVWEPHGWAFDLSRKVIIETTFIDVANTIYIRDFYWGVDATEKID